MTKSLRKLTEDIHRIAEALAEFQRGLDRVEHNLIIVEATSNAASAGYCSKPNGHIGPIHVH